MVQTLSDCIKELDHVVLFDEIPGQPVLSKTALNKFRSEKAKIAVSMQERLAGCQARLKSR